MDRSSLTLRVYFEDPFWVGIFEHVSEDHLSVCRVIFGAESKDQELYDFILKNYHRLRFSPAVKTAAKEKKSHYKREQREVKKQMHSSIGTKSQQALKLQQEAIKNEKKLRHRMSKMEQKQQQFDLK